MTQIVTMKQQVYAIIKLRIANGTYPRGYRLQELDLAGDLNVSRSPVREALKQLVCDDLALEIPNKGVLVRSFTKKELSDVFDARMLIECHALDLLEKNPRSLPREILENLLTLEEDLSRKVDYVMEPDVNIHYALLQSTDNFFLIEAHKKASTISMIHHTVLFQQNYYQLTIQAHMNVAQALLEQNYLVAKQELIEHLEHSREAICSKL